MKNRLKRYLTVFSFLVLVSQETTACGWYVEYDEIRYLVMNPDIKDNKAWWNYFYFSAHLYYGDVKIGDKDERKIASEWKKRLKLSSTEEEIFQYIFRYNEEKKLSYASLEKELKDNKPWSTFIGFARDCEGAVFSSDPWVNINNDSLIDIRSDLLKQGLSKLSEQKDQFWKKKYAFQVLRLAFYQNDGTTFRNIYNNYFGFRKEKSPVDWWATHYLSMEYEKMGLIDSANFLHAQVYSNSDNKMHVSHYMYTNKNFDTQLGMATNDREKANLYLLSGMKDYFNAVEEIHHVYNLYPNHPLLPLLIAREVNKVEDLYGTESINSNYYTWYWDYDFYNEENTDEIKRAAIHLRSLYEEVKNMKVLEKDDPSYYYLLLADLAILNRDISVAEQSLNKINSTDSAIIFQKSVMKTMLLTITKNINSDEAENLIANELHFLLKNRFSQFWSQQILRSLFNYIGNAYKQKGAEYKSVLCAYIANSKLYGSSWEATNKYMVIRQLDKMNSTNTIERIIDLFEKKDKNEMEKILLSPYPGPVYHWEILGTVYLRQNNIKKSLESFKKISEESWIFTFDNGELLDENPLVVSHLKKYDEDFVYWTKTQIVDTVYKIDSKPQKTFNDYLMLGNAWYNFSKFGNSWFMLDYYYQSSFLFQDEYSNFKSLTAQVNVLALTNSAAYYKRAIPLAKNAEEKAEVYYLLAWCYYMLNGESDYIEWAGKYEQMKSTVFYKGEACTITPLYDELDTLRDRWSRGY